ncbi:MAG: SMP-30/gluconolactonase/LRE family protein [Deltaproteobacteria bacterium]|jgi:gluconolactonase|nr:SMP-30/gluconolactonase/LRE family protein [Deltaproteobacteria bacterium]
MTFIKFCRRFSAFLILSLLLAWPAVSAAATRDGVEYVVKEGDALEKLALIYLGETEGVQKIVDATLAAGGGEFLGQEEFQNPLPAGRKLILPVRLTERDPAEYLLFDGLKFPEGVRYFPEEEALYFVEWEGDVIWKLKDGQKSLFAATQKGDGPNGVARDPSGDFWVVFYSSGKLARYDSSGRQTKIYEEGPAGRFVGPNDLVVDRDGGVFFTASGDFGDDWTTGREAGKVYRLSPEGEMELVDENISYANGIVISPDGRKLYVNEHRKNRILVYDLDGGAASNRRVFVQLPENCLSAGESCFETGPDGMNIDGQGNLWVAHYHSGAILKINPAGETIDRIYLPQGDTPTNVALSPDEKTLFVTESSQGLLLKIPVE